MSTRAFGFKKGLRLNLVRCRLATSTPGGTKKSMMIVPAGTLVPPDSSLTLVCDALKVSAFYKVEIGEFTWKSLDGKFTARNVTAFTGGQLVVSGGPGTLISKVNNTTPVFCTAFKPDT
jgi:hypothetical protein